MFEYCLRMAFILEGIWNALKLLCLPMNDIFCIFIYDFFPSPHTNIKSFSPRDYY